MAESLEVWEVIHKPWDKLGAIVRTGGKGGKITCKPKSLESLLRRPAILKIDPMDFLTGWSNGAVACWPKGEAPGRPTNTKSLKPDIPPDTPDKTDGLGTESSKRVIKCTLRPRGWPPGSAKARSGDAPDAVPRIDPREEETESDGEGGVSTAQAEQAKSAANSTLPPHGVEFKTRVIIWPRGGGEEVESFIVDEPSDLPGDEWLAHYEERFGAPSETAFTDTEFGASVNIGWVFAVPDTFEVPGCWRPRCLHMSRQRSVSTARLALMTMVVLSPRP